MPTDPSPLPEGVTLDPIDLVLSTRTYVAEVKETMCLLAGRCEMCDWPLYESMDKGCTVGSCSYSPVQPSEVARLRERRRSLDSLNRLTKLADATVRLAEEVERLKAENEEQITTTVSVIVERDALRTQLAAAEARVAELENDPVRRVVRHPGFYEMGDGALLGESRRRWYVTLHDQSFFYGPSAEAACAAALAEMEKSK